MNNKTIMSLSEKEFALAGNILSDITNGKELSPARKPNCDAIAEQLGLPKDEAALAAIADAYWEQEQADEAAAYEDEDE